MSCLPFENIVVNSKSSSTRNLVLLVLFFEAQHYWSELFIVPPEFRLHPPSIHHPPVSKPRRRRRMLWSATEILRPRPRPATGVVLDRDGSQDQNSPSIFGITMYHIYIYHISSICCPMILIIYHVLGISESHSPMIKPRRWRKRLKCSPHHGRNRRLEGRLSIRRYRWWHDIGILGGIRYVHITNINQRNSHHFYGISCDLMMIFHGISWDLSSGD